MQASRKIALLGDRGVGKTSLAAFFVDGRFQERYDPTIEVTYHKLIKYQRIYFQTDILDTAGMVRSYLYASEMDSCNRYSRAQCLRL